MEDVVESRKKIKQSATRQFPRLSFCLAIWAHSPAIAYSDEPPSAPPLPSSELTVDIAVSSSVADAADIFRWVDEESNHILESLPALSVYSGVIQVNISGSMYDYRARITTQRNERPVGDPVEWRCECDQDEFIERLRADIEYAAQGLELRGSPMPTRQALPRSESNPTPSDASPKANRKKPIGSLGKAGTGLLAIGMAGIAAGGTMIWVRDSRELFQEDYEKEVYKDYLIPGVSTLAAGGGLLLTGFLMLVTDRHASSRSSKQRTATSYALSANGSAVLFQTSGRF